MTIEKEAREEFTASCDHCSYIDTFFGDFMEVIEKMKDEGWKIFKIDNDWDHSCPDCAEDDELDEEI
mgnify:CR=1 FL=1